MLMIVTLVISGGQTGADLGGLKAAKVLGIATGGFMPKGWRTEDGPRPMYEVEYGLTEWMNDRYIARTMQNIRVSDATVIFGRRSPGSNRTEESCRIQGKPCIWMGMTSHRYAYKATVNTFRIWLKRHEVETLNVAGNRETVSPGIAEYVENFLMEALK